MTPCPKGRAALPVIKARVVSYSGPERRQQLPVEAVPPGEGLAGREEEPDRVVPGETDVTVRSVGDVSNEPLDPNQSGSVDVEGCAF